MWRSAFHGRQDPSRWLTRSEGSDARSAVGGLDPALEPTARSMVSCLALRNPHVRPAVTDNRGNENVMKRCMAILAATLAPSGVCAQGTAPSWPGLDQARLGTVYVLDDTGVETSGKLLRLDPDSLVLLVGDAERRFEAGRVRRIDARGDSLRSGAVIGAVVGAAMGLIVAGMSDCPGSHPGGSCPATRTAAFLVSTGVYAAIGTGIDAVVVGRTALYEAPTAPPRSARTPSSGRPPVNVTVRW